MFDDPKIFKTSDYNKFHILKENRKIKEGHANQLIKSISKDNRLHMKPINVFRDKKSRDKLYVIDGQHRLYAAKKMDLPIYYIINENPIEDSMIDDQIQLKWSLDDVLNYYLCKEHPEYIKFKSLMDKYNVSLQSVFVLLGFEKFRNSTLFRKGGIKISKNVEDFLEMVDGSFTKIKKNFLSEKSILLTRRDFLQALFSFFKKERKKAECLIKKLPDIFGDMPDKATKLTYESIFQKKSKR